MTREGLYVFTVHVDGDWTCLDVYSFVSVSELQSLLIINVFRIVRPASRGSGLTRGVRGMILTENLAWSWKMTSACRRTLTAGCALCTVPIETAATLSGLRLPATRCPSYQTILKVRWLLRRTTRYLCTSVWERGASHRGRFTGGDFRLKNFFCLLYGFATSVKLHIVLYICTLAYSHIRL